MEKHKLDVDLISEDLYILLVDECKKQYLANNKVRKNAELYVDNLDIEFEIEKGDING